MLKIVAVSCVVFLLINITNWKLKLLLFIRLSQNFKAEVSFEVGPKVRKKHNKSFNVLSAGLLTKSICFIWQLIKTGRCSNEPALAADHPFETCSNAVLQIAERHDWPQCQMSQWMCPWPFLWVCLKHPPVAPLLQLPAPGSCFTHAHARPATVCCFFPLPFWVRSLLQQELVPNGPHLNENLQNGPCHTHACATRGEGNWPVAWSLDVVLI